MNKQIAAFLVSLFLTFSTPLFAEDSDQMTRVNVNQATVQQLNETLVGVGPRIAREIVNYRESHGPFQSMEDLDKVKYIGAGLLEKNKDKIVFD